VISFAEGQQKTHFIISQMLHDANMLYNAMEFPSYLNEDLSEFNKSSDAYRKKHEKEMREKFSEKISKYMCSQEKQQDIRVIDSLINTDFGDSFLIAMS